MPVVANDDFKAEMIDVAGLHILPNAIGAWCIVATDGSGAHHEIAAFGSLDLAIKRLPDLVLKVSGSG